MIFPHQNNTAHKNASISYETTNRREKINFCKKLTTKYSVLFGTKSNFLLPLGPLTVFLSDLSFKASFEHSHWNNVTSSLAALAMSKAHCITCWVLNGRSSSGSRSPMFVSWHSSCSRAALDVKEFNAWRTVLILEFCKKKKDPQFILYEQNKSKNMDTIHKIKSIIHVHT